MSTWWKRSQNRSRVLRKKIRLQEYVLKTLVFAFGVLTIASFVAFAGAPLEQAKTRFSHEFDTQIRLSSS